MNMTYPDIDIEELNKAILIISDAASDPAYLDPKECPYDAGTRLKIENLIGSMKPIGINQAEKAKNPVGRPTNKVALPIDEVEKEIDEIRKELTQLKIDGQTMETADRIQVIKTRAALIEKIIGMKERTNNVKKTQAFVANVVGLMEDLMPQDKREEMIKRLEPFLEN